MQPLKKRATTRAQSSLKILEKEQVKHRIRFGKEFNEEPEKILNDYNYNEEFDPGSG